MGREGSQCGTGGRGPTAAGGDRLLLANVDWRAAPAFRKSVTTHAGKAVICYDPFQGGRVLALAAPSSAAVARAHRTLKYLPDFPDHFNSLSHAKQFLVEFFYQSRLSEL